MITDRPWRTVVDEPPVASAGHGARHRERVGGGDADSVSAGLRSGWDRTVTASADPPIDWRPLDRFCELAATHGVTGLDADDFMWLWWMWG